MDKEEKWQCSTGSKYPFYVIKKNMAIIPIHDEGDLVERLTCEYIQYDSDKDILYSDDFFSLYYPSGPSIKKSTYRILG